MPAQRDQLVGARVGRTAVISGRVVFRTRSYPTLLHGPGGPRGRRRASNASRDQLDYAITLLFGLIGQGRSTHEWEAIAVGHYHLNRKEQTPA